MSKKEKKAKSRGVFKKRLIYAVIAVIFVYIAIQSFSLARNGKVGYVVAENGDLQTLEAYSGFITRCEQVIKAPQSGVVEYYYPGNRHLAQGTLVCSLRDNYYGDLLEQKMEDVYQQLLNEASTSQYAADFEQLDLEIGDQLSSFITGKSANNYSSVYALKTSVQTTMAQRDNLLAILQNSTVNALLKEQGIYVDQLDERSVNVSLPAAGMISYTYDNYEGWTWEQVTEGTIESYDRSYETITLNLQEIREGAPLYRLITEQNWYITFFTDEEQGEDFEKGMSKDFYIETDRMSGKVIYKEKQGERYKIVLEVSGYLADYSNMRLVRIRFLISGEEGIKIPKECIMTQSYFKVQKKYMYDSTGKTGLMIRSEDGDEFVPVEVVYTKKAEDGTEYMYFGLPKGLEEGAHMIENGTASVAVLSEKETLPYVYTVNAGYQVLKIVEIQYESDQYAIVKGIEQYDHVLIP